MRGPRTAAALVATVACIRSAHAEDKPIEPITVAYEAPPGCPDSFAFFSEIASRTARARPARPGESARTLRVRILRDSSEFSGRLTIEEGAHASSNAREVHGATCVEVVEVLGFIAALAVDPTASTPPSRATGAGPEATATSAPPPKNETPKNETDAAPPRNVAPEITKPSAGEPVPARPAREPRFGIGVQVEAAAVADRVASGRLLAEVELDRPGAPKTAGPVFAPSLRLVVARSLDVARVPSTGAVTLRWTTASVEPCPLRFRVIDTIAFRPCAGFSAGGLAAEPSGVDNARSRSRLWLSVSTQLRLSWEPTHGVALELESGGVVPIVRDAFAFAPDVPVYKAPILALFGRAGASIYFP